MVDNNRRVFNFALMIAADEMVAGNPGAAERAGRRIVIFVNSGNAWELFTRKEPNGATECREARRGARFCNTSEAWREIGEHYIGKLSDGETPDGEYLPGGTLY